MLICFEGPDCVGKTTQVKNLSNYIKENYPKLGVTVHKFPGDIPRTILESKYTKYNNYHTQMEFLTDFYRAIYAKDKNLIDKIQSYDHVVIFDRYYYSTLIMAGDTSIHNAVVDNMYYDEKQDFKKELNDKMTDFVMDLLPKLNLPTPDLTFVLMDKWDNIEKRLEAKNKDMYESDIGLIRDVYRSYTMALGKDRDFFRLNGECGFPIVINSTRNIIMSETSLETTKELDDFVRELSANNYRSEKEIADNIAEIFDVFLKTLMNSSFYNALNSDIIAGYLDKEFEAKDKNSKLPLDINAFNKNKAIRDNFLDKLRRNKPLIYSYRKNESDKDVCITCGKKLETNKSSIQPVCKDCFSKLKESDKDELTKEDKEAIVNVNTMTEMIHTSRIVHEYLGNLVQDPSIYKITSVKYYEDNIAEVVIDNNRYSVNIEGVLKLLHLDPKDLEMTVLNKNGDLDVDFLNSKMEKRKYQISGALIMAMFKLDKGVVNMVMSRYEIGVSYIYPDSEKGSPIYNIEFNNGDKFQVDFDKLVKDRNIHGVFEYVDVQRDNVFKIDFHDAQVAQTVSKYLTIKEFYDMYNDGKDYIVKIEEKALKEEVKNEKSSKEKVDTEEKAVKNEPKKKSLKRKTTGNMKLDPEEHDLNLDTGIATLKVDGQKRYFNLAKYCFTKYNDCRFVKFVEPSKFNEDCVLVAYNTDATVNNSKTLSINIKDLLPYEEYSRYVDEIYRDIVYDPNTGYIEVVKGNRLYTFDVKRYCKNSYRNFMYFYKDSFSIDESKQYISASILCSDCDTKIDITIDPESLIKGHYYVAKSNKAKKEEKLSEALS